MSRVRRLKFYVETCGGGGVVQNMCGEGYPVQKITLSMSWVKNSVGDPSKQALQEPK